MHAPKPGIQTTAKFSLVHVTKMWVIFLEKKYAHNPRCVLQFLICKNDILAFPRHLVNFAGGFG
jgi:alpha-D-ribose 1-methylphosphonate 5-triphosphate synthase subunit PhnH